MIVYLLEHAKARWQVWLILSPGYLLFALFAVVVGMVTIHKYEEGATTNAAIGVAVTALCAGVSVYFLRIVVRRAAAMFPRPYDDTPTQ
jgi:uncharacterized membrane-anchored protein